MWRIGPWEAVALVASVIPVAYASKASPLEWDSTDLVLPQASTSSGVPPPRILQRRRGPIPGALLTSVVLVLSCVAVTFVISACVRELKGSSRPLASGIRARSLAVGDSDDVCRNEGGDNTSATVIAAHRQLNLLTLEQHDAAWLNSDEIFHILRAKDILEKVLKALGEELKELEQMQKQEADLSPGPVKNALQKFRFQLESRIEKRTSLLRNMAYIPTQGSRTVVQMAAYWAADRKVSLAAAAAVVASARVIHPEDPVPGTVTATEEGMIKRLVGSFTGKLNTSASTLRSGAATSQIIASANAFIAEGRKMAGLLQSMQKDRAAKTVSTMTELLAADLAAATTQPAGASPPSSSVLTSFSALTLSRRRGPQGQPGQPPHEFPIAQPASPPQSPPAPPSPEVQPQVPDQPAGPPSPPSQQPSADSPRPGDYPGQLAGDYPAHPGEGAQPDPGAALAPGAPPQALGPPGSPPPLSQHAPVGSLPPQVGNPGAEPPAPPDVGGQPDPDAALAPGVPPQALGPSGSPPPLSQHAPVGLRLSQVGLPGAGPPAPPDGVAQPGPDAVLAPGQLQVPAGPPRPLSQHAPADSQPLQGGNPSAGMSGHRGGSGLNGSKAPSLSWPAGGASQAFGGGFQHPVSPAQPSPMWREHPARRPLSVSFASQPRQAAIMRSASLRPPRGFQSSSAPMQRSVSLQLHSRTSPTQPLTGLPLDASPQEPASPQSPTPPSPASVSSRSPSPPHATRPSTLKDPGSRFSFFPRGFSLRLSRKRNYKALTQSLNDWALEVHALLEPRPKGDEGMANLERSLTAGVRLYNSAEAKLADAPTDDKRIRETRQALRTCASLLEEARLLLASRWGTQLSDARGALLSAQEELREARNEIPLNSAPLPESESVQALMSLADALNQGRNLLRTLKPLLTTPSLLVLILDSATSFERSIQKAGIELQEAGAATAAAWRNMLTSASHASGSHAAGLPSASSQPLGPFVNQARLILEVLASAGIYSTEVRRLEDLVKEAEKRIARKQTSVRKRR